MKNGSMDWFKGTFVYNRKTIDFPMKIMGFSCKFSLKPMAGPHIRGFSNPNVLGR